MNLEVHVIPGARKQEIRREGSLLKVRLLSRPIEGRANEELIALLATRLGLKKREIAIMMGERDRRKVVSLPLTDEQVRALLEGGTAGQKG
jgi:uncharacterized protein YggU (UPF0235/DUF167 family)